ncbi:hypothetical protein [Velocimicrobium porci]|uniref:MacB-like periplasmic core domain-containing protein n=1 Tax=Velocimicrobium porci TaxID=2606634 RepID=A0A6L5Y073_9FIRM|nr:hypothetical protein [Velocimicrobium porci]MSS63838.1 hypothetical protein [Velocimicrobium porci]
MHTKKSFLTIFSFIIFLIYFTFFGILTPFLTSVPLKNGGFKTFSSKNDLYKMVDNFYNQLNSSEDFDLLTSFNQAIEVTDFKGDNNFYYNSEEFIEKHTPLNVNIKSLQLNQKAYHFYKIEIDNGIEIPWDDISYKDKHIPVLLGPDYKKYYHYGDIIKGNYYSKDVDFEVIGFLKDGCSIKYKNISDLNLDTYMLIPYPPSLWEVNDDFQFESLLYFAMVNCDIVPFVSETQILKDIKEIANQTGFTNFSFVGIDNFQIQNIELLLFIQEHQKIFIFSMIAIFILINIIGIKIFRLIFKANYTNSTKKQKKYRYIRIFTFHIIIPYGIAFLLSVFLSVAFLKKILPISILLEIMTLLLTYIIIYVFSQKALPQ